MTTMTAAQIRAQTARMEQLPDPQVPERPRPPRTYPAAYKLRILAQYEQLDKSALAALGQAKRRGRPPVDPLQRENARLVADNARLRDRLVRQAKVLEVQGELSALLSRLAASSADPDPSEPTGPADPTQTSR